MSDELFMLGPPSGWTRLPGKSVMTNLDHSVDAGVAGRLRDGGHWSCHDGWNFNGIVWFADGRWYERVSRYRRPQGTYSAETLEELMKVVNDEFGWA